MAKIVYNTEVRKSGYEWVKPEDLAEKLIEWDFQKNEESAQSRANLYNTNDKSGSENYILVPCDPTPTAQMTIKPMERDIWISFYRLAEKTKIGTDPLPHHEIRDLILKFFKKYGIANNEPVDYEELLIKLRLMNDLFLARDEGDMDEVYRLLQSTEQSRFNFLSEFTLLLNAKFSLNSEKKIEMVIDCVSFWDFVLYDFMFSKGVIEKNYICKYCDEHFQWHRKKDYCSPKCKRRAAYERQLIKGRDK